MGERSATRSGCLVNQTDQIARRALKRVRLAPGRGALAERLEIGSERHTNRSREGSCTRLNDPAGYLVRRLRTNRGLCASVPAGEDGCSRSQRLSGRPSWACEQSRIRMIRVALELDGMMVAQVTPFTAGGEGLDLDWIPQHLDWLRHFGLSAILTMGTNGEGPSLSLQERRAIVKCVVANKGEYGVVAGAGCVALPETIEAANDALDAGADAVALLPPYFFKNIDAAGLVNYFSAVMESLPAQAKVLLYNMPVHAGIDIPDEVALALLELHGPMLAGIKDSSGDAERTRRYLELSNDWTVLAGADGAHADLYAAGCVGGVSGFANAVPALVKTIQHVHREGGDAQRPQRQLNELKAALQPFPAVSALKQLTAFTSSLPRPAVRPPHRDLSDSDVSAVEEAIGRYLVAAEA